MDCVKPYTVGVNYDYRSDQWGDTELFISSVGDCKILWEDNSWSALPSPTDRLNGGLAIEYKTYEYYNEVTSCIYLTSITQWQANVYH